MVILRRKIRSGIGQAFDIQPETYSRVGHRLVGVSVRIVRVGKVLSGLALVDEGGAHGVQDRLSVCHRSHTVKDGHSVQVLSNAGLSVSRDIIVVLLLVVKHVVDRLVNLIGQLVVFISQGGVLFEVSCQKRRGSEGLVPQDVNLSERTGRRSFVRQVPRARRVLPSSPVSCVRGSLGNSDL